MTLPPGAGRAWTCWGEPGGVPSNAPVRRGGRPREPHPRPRVLRRGGAAWPANLEHLPDPPARLWLRGAVPPAGPAVAIVGARHASFTGLDVAHELGASLAGTGVQVISGMAFGVDGAAHRGALEGGGSTVAVLGCGVDICYPACHQALRDAILSRGCVLSEDPPGTPPDAWRFPRRNRLIAALSQAVVVVEAGLKSGALSTARHAAELGREVLAVPGSVRNPQAAGTNRLIRDGATPLLELADLLDAVPALAAAGRGEAGATPNLFASPGAAPGGPQAARLLSLMAADPVHPDDLAAQLGLDVPRLAQQLTTLELAGWVRVLADGRVAALSPAGRGRRASTGVHPSP